MAKDWTLAVDNPRNSRLLRHLAGLSWRPLSTTFTPPDESHVDPYRELGCHPGAVRRVWDDFGSRLPVDCRCLIYGLPSLATPFSGLILAVAWGTNYVMQVPPEVPKVLASTQSDLMSYLISKFALDPSKEFGDTWILGMGLKDEPQWCRVVFDEDEQTCSHKLST